LYLSKITRKIIDIISNLYNIPIKTKHSIVEIIKISIILVVYQIIDVYLIYRKFG